MPLIAMTREMGSLGMDVARIIEAELGVPLVYHEIIDQLSDKMRLRKSHVVRLLSGKASLVERLTADKTSLSIYTADETLQLASRGAVLRGWGASHLLRPVKHAVCVRVCAPFEKRVERMMQRVDSDDHDAVAAEIRLNDEAQGAIVKRHFGVDWRNPELYDVALNTERMSVEECAGIILQMTREAAFRETAASAAVLAALTLAAKVRAALRADPATRKLQFLVAAEGGIVMLAGMVAKREERASAERVAAAVAGVTGVRNELRASEDIHHPMGG